MIRTDHLEKVTRRAPDWRGKIRRLRAPGDPTMLHASPPRASVRIRVGYDSINQNFLLRKPGTIKVLDHRSLPLDALCSGRRR